MPRSGVLLQSVLTNNISVQKMSSWWVFSILEKECFRVGFSSPCILQGFILMNILKNYLLYTKFVKWQTFSRVRDMLRQKWRNAPGSLHCSDISLTEIVVYPFVKPLLFDGNIRAVTNFVNILIQILDCSNSQRHFNIYEEVVLLAEVWVVGNRVLFGLKQLYLHQKHVCVQHDCRTILSAFILWTSLNIDIGLITERKWKLLATSIIHHRRAVGIILATWTVHHLV